MLRAYFGEILSHRPERSGLPSGVRGAGAVRFGLPSGVRGIPGVGCFSHCAVSGALSATVSIAIADEDVDMVMAASSLKLLLIGPAKGTCMRVKAPRPSSTILSNLCVETRLQKVTKRSSSPADS